MTVKRLIEILQLHADADPEAPVFIKTWDYEHDGNRLYEMDSVRLVFNGKDGSPLSAELESGELLP